MRLARRSHFAFASRVQSARAEDPRVRERAAMSPELRAKASVAGSAGGQPRMAGSTTVIGAYHSARVVVDAPGVPVEHELDASDGRVARQRVCDRPNQAQARNRVQASESFAGQRDGRDPSSRR